VDITGDDIFRNMGVYNVDFYKWLRDVKKKPDGSAATSE